jgi:outer membrane receptor protein involved in Fe transport
MRRPNVLLLFLLIFSLSAPLYAQTIDTAIVGTVSDNSGAVIPGANVVVLSVATGIEKKAVTAGTGEYGITYLAPGKYDLTVSAPGFVSVQQKGIVLQINQQARINIALKAGAAEQTVQVSATQPLLQSEDSSLGVVVGTESAQNLPLNGRKFDDLAILTPGVTVYNPDNHTSTEDGAAINAYGSQQTWAQVNVDGVTMVNNRHAYVNLYPSVDAIQEFKVLTGNAEAEYGGGAGTITNIQIKTGTNALHGDVFEFFRNTAMDARNFFLVAPAPKQVLKQNQFGATLGGPVIKDRTFFFFSYEGIRSVEQSAGLTNVLTPAEENGDFSALLPATQLVSPYTGQPYLNNQIPVDPVAQQIAKNYMPQSNTSQNGQNYAYVTGGNLSVDQEILRLDHKISDRDQLTFHFLHAYRHSPSVDPNPNFTYNGTFPIYNMGLQYVHSFSANVINELRLGYDFEHQKLVPSLANTNFTPASIGINGFVQPNGAPFPPPETGFPILSTNDLIGIGENSGIGLDDSRTYQLVDNITWTRGRHALTFGGDFRHVQDNADTSNTPYGVLNFNGSETANNGVNAPATEGGFDGADFILGVPSSVTTPEGVPLTAARQWRVFTYAQDNWKVTPNLTLNLGLRYDLWVPPHDNLDTSATLDWSTPTPTLIPLPTPLWQVSHKDFSPRIGFAYSLPHQFVVRSAYGITFYGGQFDNINILQLNPPKDPSFSLVNGNCGYCTPGNAPTSTFQNPVSPSITPATANVVSIPPDGKHPDLYLQTWNFTVSRQFWSNVIDISYVGVKGTHQDTSILNFNTGAPQQPGANVQAGRPYPSFGQMRVLDYHGASIYNGLNIHFEHRLTHGLDFTASYSFSHLLDNQGGDTNGVRNETQIPTAKEWANGLTDQRQNLTVAFVWMLPKFTGGNALTRGAVNGWGINGIYQFLAGNPLYVSQATDGENNGNPFQRPDLVPGQAETVPNRTIAEWFNTNAFSTAIGHYGSTPRNPAPLVSPANDPLTLAINRSFPTPFEGQHLDFRVEAFNALNTPQFGPPGSTQGTSTFGVITSTATNNRELQLALKYIF